MKVRIAIVGGLSTMILACSGPAPEPAPATMDDETIVTFAPVGDRAFLVEEDPGALHQRLRTMLENGQPDRATRAYANRWVQPPGWSATIEAFGEPADGDLFSDMGYPYRTNLVAPGSGVVVLAYTKEAPPAELWKAEMNVQVNGRLEGYARRPPGVVILLDAELQPAEPSGEEPASVAFLSPEGE